jgi:hypothetical protein
MKRVILAIGENFLSRRAPPQRSETIITPASILVSSEFLFEPWYKKKYTIPDNIDSVAHYLSVGAAKQYDPNPLFRCSWYAETYKLPPDASKNATLHYLMVGSKNGLRPNPFFEPNWYRNSYPEVAASGMEPLVHYLKFGAKEGRHPSSDVYTQWLPQALDEESGALQNPLVSFLDLIELLRLPQKTG